MTFENGSLTGSAGAGTTGGTVSLERTAPIKGAYSATIPKASSSYLEQSFTGVDNLYVSFYLRINALPTSNVRIALISDGPTNEWIGTIYLLTTGKLRLQIGNTATATGATTLSVGTTYRVAIHQQKGTGTNAILEGYLAAGDAPFGAPFGTMTNGTWTSQATRLRIGATTANVLNATFDNISLDSGSMP